VPRINRMKIFEISRVDLFLIRRCFEAFLSLDISIYCEGDFENHLVKIRLDCDLICKCFSTKKFRIFSYCFEVLNGLEIDQTVSKPCDDGCDTKRQCSDTRYLDKTDDFVSEDEIVKVIIVKQESGFGHFSKVK
jgi:hypothetical protein